MSLFWVPCPVCGKDAAAKGWREGSATHIVCLARCESFVLFDENARDQCSTAVFRP